MARVWIPNWDEPEPAVVPPVYSGGGAAPAARPAEPIQSSAYKSPGDNRTPAGRIIPAGIGSNVYDANIVWWSGFGIIGGKVTSSFAMVFKDCLFAPQFTLLKLYADDQLIISRTGSARRETGTIRYYDGTQTARDPLLLARLGATNCSAWPGYAYMVAENFDCSSYGNRVPLFRAVLSGSSSVLPGTEEQSTLSFGAFGGGYVNGAFTVDPIRNHHYQIVQDGNDDAFVVTVDIASLEEINRVRIFATAPELAAGFGIVSFPVPFYGSDFIAVTVSLPKFMPAVLNVQTGGIATALEPNLTAADCEISTVRAVPIDSAASTKFLVVCELVSGPGGFGHQMGVLVADVTAGTMAWIIHPYAAPASGSSLIGGPAENPIEFGPIADGVATLWYRGTVDNIHVAHIGVAGFASGLFYAEPDPAKSPIGIAYDPARAVLAVYRQDGSWLKLDASTGAVISTHAGSGIIDLNVNHWSDNVTSTPVFNAFYHAHRSGWIVAARGQPYGDIYEINLEDFTTTLLIDRSDFSDDDVAIHFDQFAGVMTEGSDAGAGIINKVTLGGAATLPVDLVDVFQQVATFDGRFDAADLVFTGFPGNETQGIKLENDTTLDNLEQSVADAFDVKIVESDGFRKYIYPPRDGSFTITATLGDADFVEKGGEIIVKTIGASEDEQVGCTFEYFDVDVDFKRLPQTYKRPLGVYDVSRSTKKRTVNTVLALTASQALQLATLAVYRSVLGNETFTFDLVPGRLGMEPADILAFDFRGFTMVARIREATLNADYTQSVSAYQYLQFEAATYTGTSLALPEPVAWSAFARLIHLDVPLLAWAHDLDGTGLVEYAQMLAYGSSPLRDATLYKSPDGTTWANQGAIYSAAPIAGTITALTGTDWSWPPVKDAVNSLAVLISHGDIDELGAITDSELDAGLNLAAVGAAGRWVLIQFQSVVTAAGSAELSDIMWGVHGSEVWLGELAAGDTFVLLDPALYTRFQHAPALLGDTLRYKAATSAAPFDAVPTLAAAAAGVAETPYACVNLDATLAGSDILLAWDYRSRVAAGANPSDHGEASLAFEIDIMDGGAVTRTLNATTNAKTYLDADIAADFGSLPGTLTFRVYMMSAVVGRGYMAQATINFFPPTADADTITADDTTITADSG